MTAAAAKEGVRIENPSSTDPLVILKHFGPGNPDAEPLRERPLDRVIAMSNSTHKFPALHNAMWPGIVGKGGDSEPAIDLDTMLSLTAAAEVDGTRFDGVDLFLSLPHTDIDSTDDRTQATRGQTGCSPVSWPARWSRRFGRRVGGGSAMGSEEERGRFLTQVRKACAIGKKLRDLGIRKYGVVRIDSAEGPASWAENPAENTKRIAETFREACTIAEGYGERLAAEGEICWGGMHGWKHMVEFWRQVESPQDAWLPGGYGAHHALYTGL